MFLNGRFPKIFANVCPWNFKDWLEYLKHLVKIIASISRTKSKFALFLQQVHFCFKIAVAMIPNRWIYHPFELCDAILKWEYYLWYKFLKWVKSVKILATWPHYKRNIFSYSTACDDLGSDNISSGS
jgi:hypothetical protein